MSKLIISSIFFFFALPILCFAEDPIPYDSFVMITENIIDKFDVMEEEAKDNYFNRENPTLIKEFYSITAAFKKYKRYTSLEINDWPVGLQHAIASKLREVNSLYKVYSNSSRDSFTKKVAEEKLKKARELFREYLKLANKK